MKDELETLLEFLSFPLASTEAIFQKFATIPGSDRRGSGLDQFLYVRGRRDDKILLVAHADTVWDREYNRSLTLQQDIVFQKGIIRNRKGGLGADDRAGCAIIWQLREMGHSVLITSGEENGCRGSTWLMNCNRDLADEINSEHGFVVQFDRRNGTDFKCYSVGTDEFRQYVHQSTSYFEPDRRSYTDIVTLCKDICGVNMSIGYHEEHTEREYLVAAEWQNTLSVCQGWLSKELPCFRLNGRIA